MRILHIVTLVAADGSFGGPVRVAFNLARELQAHGHDVIVAGTTRGYDPIPTTIGDVPVRLWRAHQVVPFAGFLGIFAPALFFWMWRHHREFDVVHVHMARDMVSLPAAALALVLGKRVILQTHGMVDESDHPLAPLLDRILTRPVLRRAKAVLFLTEQERRDLIHVAERVVLHELPNGVPSIEATSGRSNASATPEVLFLARLHERKHPQLFVEAAGVLLAEGLWASFVLVGPDQGEGSKVLRAIEKLGDHARSVSWQGALPLEATLERMKRASIYVLPSVNEPFPMSVLEAMSVGLPVIATESCGLADVIRESGSGIVVNGSKESLVSAMRRLLTDGQLREQMSSAARTTATELCGMGKIGTRLIDIYERDGVSTYSTRAKAGRG